jgi:hypothetical protein
MPPVWPGHVLHELPIALGDTLKMSLHLEVITPGPTFVYVCKQVDGTFEYVCLHISAFMQVHAEQGSRYQPRFRGVKSCGEESLSRSKTRELGPAMRPPKMLHGQS